MNRFLREGVNRMIASDFKKFIAKVADAMQDELNAAILAGQQAVKQLAALQAVR